MFQILFLFNFNSNTYSQTKLFLANNYNFKTLNSNCLNKISSDDYILGKGDSILVKVSEQNPNLDTQYISSHQKEYLLRTQLFISSLKLLNLLKELLIQMLEQIAKYKPIQILINGEVENQVLFIM